MLDSNLLKWIDCQQDKRYGCYFLNVLKQKDFEFNTYYSVQIRHLNINKAKTIG